MPQSIERDWWQMDRLPLAVLSSFEFQIQFFFILFFQITSSFHLRNDGVLMCSNRVTPPFICAPNLVCVCAVSMHIHYHILFRMR